jgi:hypothetical protein
MEGGAVTNVLVKFVYFKAINVIRDKGKIPGYIYEEWKNIYIVDDELNAYKMEDGIVDDMYVLALNLPANKIFKFRFLRDKYLEFLDEDPDLMGIYGPDASDTNVNESGTRWRYIIPTRANQLYVYSYALPYLDIDVKHTNRDLFLTNVSRRKGLQIKKTIKDNVTIQEEKKMRMLNYYKGEYIKDLDIEKVTLVAGKYGLLNIIRHNLGHDTAESTTENDKYKIKFFNHMKTIVPKKNDDIDDIYKQYYYYSCRGDNLYLYLKHYVIQKVNILTTQFEGIVSDAKIVGMIEPEKLDTNLAHISSISKYNYRYLNTHPHLERFSAGPGVGIEPDEKNAYQNQQLCYRVYETSDNFSGFEISTILGPYYIKIKNWTGRFAISELTKTIDNLLTRMATLSRITLGNFGSLPLTIAEYIEFFKKYKRVSLEYQQKIEVIKLLLELKDRDISTSDPTIVTIKLNMADKGSVVLKNDNNFAAQQNTEIVKELYTILKAFDKNKNDPYSWRTDPATKGYLMDVMHDHILTLQWIEKCIIGLYIKLENRGGIYEHVLGISIGPAISLNELIRTNAGLIDKNQFYKFILTIYDRANGGFGNFLKLRNPADTDIDIIEDGSVGTERHIVTGDGPNEITSRLVDTVLLPLYDKASSMQEAYNQPPLPDKHMTDYLEITFNKLLNDSHQIKDHTMNRVSLFMSMFRKDLDRLYNAFWLDLNSISLDKFLASPTIGRENIAKLYVKMITVFYFMKSSNGRELDNMFGNGASLATVPLADRPTFDYYDFINENVTFVRLQQIAKYYNMLPSFNIKMDMKYRDALAEMNYHIPLYNIIVETNSEVTGSGAELFDPAQVSNIPLGTYADGTDGDTLPQVLRDVMGLIENDERFRDKIDEMYNSILGRGTNIIPTTNLTY